MDPLPIYVRCVGVCVCRGGGGGYSRGTMTVQ